MPNSTEEPIPEVHQADWITYLQRLEKIGADLRKRDGAIPPERRQQLEAELFDLHQKLPAGIALAIRPRLNSGRPLIASAGGGRCGSCYVAMPRGDHTAVLAGAKIVPCQYCGVLLFADEDERRRMALLRQTQEKKTARRK